MTAVLAALTVVLCGGWLGAQEPENQWEPAIRAFEEKDKTNPPAPGGVVFIGSSTIVGWDLQKHFPGLPATNRGFGGSQIADSTLFVDRIVVPYKPRLVVLYAGDNDIASGKSPEKVAADFAEFVAKVRAGAPEVWIAYLGIKPSIARWALVEKMRQANALIRQACEADPNAFFVDTEAPMLGDDGTPRKDLLNEDGLHLNEAGYELWSSVLRPYLNAGVWTAEENGLRYTDIRVGEGPIPQRDQTVSTHYAGRLADGTKFDASRDRGDQPLDFPIGIGRVIKGWDIGLLTMHVGGIRRLVIPPELAYGDQGVPGVIPPRDTLTFDVELVAVKGAPHSETGPGE